VTNKDFVFVISAKQGENVFMPVTWFVGLLARLLKMLWINVCEILWISGFYEEQLIRCGN